ncbi:MAG: hypothetical protein H6609_20080 [Ignavibacteriales bacterium]|nr:hypothetical protein [Ignavibacteriales bacterium]
MQNGPVDTDDIKFKLWKNPNEDLVYGGNFLATEVLMQKIISLGPILLLAIKSQPVRSE